MFTSYFAGFHAKESFCVVGMLLSGFDFFLFFPSLVMKVLPLSMAGLWEMQAMKKWWLQHIQVMDSLMPFFAHYIFK
jgi:hypothetical protein